MSQISRRIGWVWDCGPRDQSITVYHPGDLWHRRPDSQKSRSVEPIGALMQHGLGQGTGLDLRSILRSAAANLIFGGGRTRAPIGGSPAKAVDNSQTKQQTNRGG